MPGKRARRHFSQLSEFERGLIIGMKTVGWSTRRVAGQVDRSECAVRNSWEQWTREGPFVNGLPEAIFQQDNARPHTARVTQDFLRHFQTLPWLARSPDLSPVEHVWDQLKRQMPSCHSVHDLELAVQDLRSSYSVLTQGRLKAWANWAPATMDASSPSQLSLNKIVIQIILTVKCFYRLHSTENWKFQMIGQLATCNGHCPCTGLDLPTGITITHSVKRRYSVELVCAGGSTMENIKSLTVGGCQNDVAIEMKYNDAINDFARIEDPRKPLLYQYNDSDSTKNKDI
ncbi:uncharacterized protein TNCV_1492481 [Trichonephila clavipes]|nr:uncharacterized protein TNCV_1492481 [Trichonephila clavipes]